MKKVVLVFCVLLFSLPTSFAQILHLGGISVATGQEKQLLAISASCWKGNFHSGDVLGFQQGSVTIFWSNGGIQNKKTGSDSLFTYVEIPEWSAGLYHVNPNGNVSDGVLLNAFVVTESPITTKKNWATKGQKISVDISGLKTHFTSKGQGTKVWLGKQKLTYSRGYFVSSLNSLNSDSLLVTDTTKLRAFFNLSDTFQNGYYDIYVEDSIDKTIASYSGFYVTSLKSVFPNKGYKGVSQNITISALSGTFDSTTLWVGFEDENGFSQGSSTLINFKSTDSLTGKIPINMPPGTYDLIVSNDSFYPSKSFRLPNAFTVSLSPYLISGYCFLDTNYDAKPDSEEVKIKLPSLWLTSSSASDTSRFLIRNNIEAYMPDTGSYIITPALPKNFKKCIPSSDTIHFTTGGVIQTVPFALQYTKGIKELYVTITRSGISRPGRANYYTLTFGNKGDKSITADVILKYDKQFTFDSASMKETKKGNDSVDWNLKLGIFEEKSIQVKLTLNSKATLGTYLHNFVTILPIKGDTLPTDNYDSTTNDIVRASYDPNDKAVSPSGGITNADIDSGKYLDYTIRFQNTGNDTAFKVVVKDSISNKYDLTSFEMVDASHPYKLLYKKGLFTWTFENILLPDSTTNEEQSHGFIRYKIKPSDKLTPGDLITNKAAIYFDYNTPVLTNETSTEVLCPFINDSVTLTGKTLTAVDTTCTYQWLDCNKSNAPISGATSRSFTTKTSGAYAVALTKSTCVDTSKCNTVVVTGTEELSLSSYRLSVYPNPTKGLINVEVASLSKLSFEIKVYDMMGQLILTSQPELVSGSYAQLLTLDLNGKAKGIYLIKCVSKEGIMHKRILLE